jgi:RNA polymerase sigma factor (sigma-70 family)
MPAEPTQDEPSALVRQALEQHESSLIAYAAGILRGDIDRARDVVQDTFLRLYLSDPVKVRENLKAWLYTVCRNRALDCLRKDQRLELGNEDFLAAAPCEQRNPAQEADANELHERVWQLLDRLSHNQREVIRLKFQHDCSYQEIADITGLSTGNVGFLMHVAIKKLRELLGKELATHSLN